MSVHSFYSGLTFTLRPHEMQCRQILYGITNRNSNTIFECQCDIQVLAYRMVLTTVFLWLCLPTGSPRHKGKKQP